MLRNRVDTDARWAWRMKATLRSFAALASLSPHMPTEHLWTGRFVPVTTRIQQMFLCRKCNWRGFP